jgi:hypothetical protein
LKHYHFDPNDRPLIERAAKTGDPADVAEAVRVAADAFEQRIRAMGGLPMVAGQPGLLLEKPTSVFDDVVIRTVLAEYAEASGQAIQIHWAPSRRPPGTVACPDVQIVWP